MTDTKFKPGQSGNPHGRPRGGRNKLAEAFLQALAEDFEEHGVDVIQQVREGRPHEYLKICANIIPKDFNLSTDAVFHHLITDEPMSEEEWEKRYCSGEIEHLSDDELEVLASGHLEK